MRTSYSSRFLGSALGLLTVVVLAQTGQAAGRVTGFETGDEAITSIGDAGVRTAAYQGEAAPEGSNQYLITTIRNTDTEDGATNQSGTDASNFTNLNNFFFGQTVSNQDGSGILIPFTVGAGDGTITLQYDFLSNEPGQGTPRGDFAFDAIFTPLGVLQGSVNHFQTASASNPANLFGAQSPFVFHSGYQTLTLDVSGLAAGSYKLGIGIADAINTSHASGLLIDNVQVNAAVPEPSTLGLIVAGAAGFAAVRRRIRK